MFTDIYRNKKILITGHTGFKGSWLAQWLQMLGANIAGIALKPNTTPSHFQILKLDCESYFTDIRNQEQIAKIINQFKPEIIFHLAAQPIVFHSYQEPLDTLNTNIIGTANILNTARNCDNLKAVIIVTSDKCYENKEQQQGYRETDTLGGRDPYSASKACAELITSSFRDSYFNLENFNKTHQTLIASVRAGNVIGGGDWSPYRIIPDAIRAITNKQKLLLRNPNSVRAWQHVLDCLSGYLCLGEKLLQGDKQLASAWNFSSEINEQATVLNLIKSMQKIWPKLDYEISASKTEPHETSRLHLDISKANSLLKWQPIWNLEQSIEATIRWYQNFYESNIISTAIDIENYYNDAEKSGTRWSNH